MFYRFVAYTCANFLWYLQSGMWKISNFLDQKDARFHVLQGTCDSLFCELRQEGIDANSKKTSLISKEEENLLWETGVQRHYSEMRFSTLGSVSVRGGEEQHQLKLSQLIRKKDTDHRVYVETGS